MGYIVGDCDFEKKAIQCGFGELLCDGKMIM